MLAKKTNEFSCMRCHNKGFNECIKQDLRTRRKFNIIVCKNCGTQYVKIIDDVKQAINFELIKDRYYTKIK